MKKITNFYAMTLMALAILFFSCSGKSPRMPEPDVPKNPKEKQEPKKPAPTPPTPEPQVPTPPAPEPPAPTPPAPEPQVPTPPAPEPPAPTPPAPEPPAPTPPAPEPPAPTPPAPTPPEPTPPAPTPPAPTPPAPTPPAPPSPTPPTPQPPKEKVLTVLGQWRLTWSKKDYDNMKEDWKSNTGIEKHIYTFEKDGSWSLVSEIQGLGTHKSSGAYTLSGSRLIVKVVNRGPLAGIEGTFEVIVNIWNENNEPDEIKLKGVDNKSGYILLKEK